MVQNDTAFLAWKEKNDTVLSINYDIQIVVDLSARTLRRIGNGTTDPSQVCIVMFW